jgi:hypothetical protein
MLCLASIAAPGAEPKQPTVIARVMRAADKSKDGKLSLAEYLLLDVQTRHHAGEYFKAGDSDGDGFLNEAELATTLRKQTWFAILTEGVDASFTRLDLNKDGRLDVTGYRKIARMGGHTEQHFKGADVDKDGLLDRTGYTAHAEAKVKEVHAVAPKKKTPRR